MNKSPLKSTLTLAGATVLMTLLAACGPTIPKINSLKIGKDKDISKETATFAPKDTIHGEADVSSPGKASIKWMVYAEKVEGVADNAHLTNADVTVDLQGSSTATYSFPPGDGFPAGKYRIEVHMLGEDGAEKDTKSATYTVANP